MPKCSKVSHTIKNCWAKGGSAEGKGPKVKSNPKSIKVKLNDTQAKLVKIKEIDEISIFYTHVKELKLDEIGDRVSSVLSLVFKGTTLV